LSSGDSETVSAATAEMKKRTKAAARMVFVMGPSYKKLKIYSIKKRSCQGAKK
jgi:hypothetical protein